MAKKNLKTAGKLKKAVTGAVLTAAVASSAFWMVKRNQPISPLPSYEVQEVIDGDTFITTEKQHIRLRDANAPDKGNCGYQEAKAELEQLVMGEPVYLLVKYHDQYRLYAEVYTPSGEVNELMVKSGWARYDRSQKQNLIDARQHAQDNLLGIYGQCIATEPETTNCVIKGNINTKTSEKIYYFPGCIPYNRTVVEKDQGEAWFCSEAEAKTAGYRKALTCFGKSWPASTLR